MDAQFQQVDFGPLKQFLDNDDVTDISYSNGGQVWIKTLSKGVYRAYQDCRMKTNECAAFCPVCQRAITRMIDFYTK